MYVDCGFVLENHARRSPRPHLFPLSLHGKKESVDTVHTLPVGLGRTSAGLARFGHVSGGMADSGGPEPGSSPTSGTYFPSSGAGWPLSVDNLFTDGPLRGAFFR